MCRQVSCSNFRYPAKLNHVNAEHLVPQLGLNYGIAGLALETGADLRADPNSIANFHGGHLGPDPRRNTGDLQTLLALSSLVHP
jgi:hypothetical protein